MKRTSAKTAVIFGVFLTAVLCWGMLIGCGPKMEHRTLLNVSYDPTRELFKEYNEKFEEYWLDKTGEEIKVETSNGGSGGQSRAVISGQEADVITLALAWDIQEIVKQAGLIQEGWQERLDYNSSPYTSTIVFLVRKGNPKNIRDWDDLVQPGIKIVTPNPKTSGGARWNYLAAWGFELNRELQAEGGLAALNDPTKKEKVEAAQKKAFNFVQNLFKNAIQQGMASGARDATDTFSKNEIGDVLLAWENEAFLSQRLRPEEGFEIVRPSISILAEPPVAVVDQIVDRRGTRDIAEEYLKYLYDPEIQKMIASHYYRPRILPEDTPENKEFLDEYKKQFPDMPMFSIDDVFGGWEKAQNEHFNADKNFDQMMQNITK